MAISRDSTVYSNNDMGTGTSHSASDVTIPSGAEFAIVHITFYKSPVGFPSTSGLTLDSQSGTKVEEVNGSHNSWFTAMWYVDGFASGSSKTLSFSTDDTLNYPAIAEIAFYSGGDISSGLTSLKRDSDSVQELSGSPPQHISVSLTTVSDDYVVQGNGTDDSTNLSYDNGSSFVTNDGNPPYGAMVEYTAVGTSTTMGVTGTYPSMAALAMIAAASGSTDTLLANDIESASEVTSPAIGQIHALLATSVQSLSNVGTPTITQLHALLATSVQSLSEVGAPTLSQLGTDVLLAASIESASQVSTPALTQLHALLATSIESLSEVSNPVLDRPVQLSRKAHHLGFHLGPYI